MSSAKAGILLLIGVLALPGAAAGDDIRPAATDGPVGADVAGFAVQEAFGHSEWAELDSLLARYCDSREPRLDDGRWKLSGVNLSLVKFFDAYGTWEMMFRKIDEWRRERPDTTSADLVESILWYSWAWSARGDGYAKDVTPEGWQLFRERLQEAAAVLKRSRETAGACPLYYEVWLIVLLGLDASDAEIRDAFEAGVKRFPDYTPLYLKRTLALLPWWGGSYEEVDAFINEAVERNLGGEGEALYARIWLWVANDQSTEFNLFRDTPADWSRMRKGFELLVERYPRSGFLANSFAAYACRADDKNTYKAVRERFTPPYYLPAWPSNLSVEICDLRMIGTG